MKLPWLLFILIDSHLGLFSKAKKSKIPQKYIMAHHTCHKLCEKANFYAPNFEDVDGAYWFWVMRPAVCASMHPSVQEPCMLGFWIFIYGFLMEKYLTPVFFLVRVISLSGVMPVWKNQHEILSARYLEKYLSKGLETWLDCRGWWVD